MTINKTKRQIRLRNSNKRHNLSKTGQEIWTDILIKITNKKLRHEKCPTSEKHKSTTNTPQLEWLKFKKMTIASVDEDVKQLEVIHTASRDAKWSHMLNSSAKYKYTLTRMTQ